MAKKLTARSIEQAKPDPTKRREIPDAGKPGLYLLIQPSGRKSWAVRYRFHGRPRKVTLDGFPSLGVAHKLAHAELDKVAEGRDPASEKRAAKQATPEDSSSNLFETVMAQFIERHVKRNTRASSAHETERLLRKEVLPKWKRRHIQEISKRQVLDLLDGIVDRGGGLSANRTLAAVRKLFNWALQRGIIDASPVASIKAPLAERSRDRILTDDEVRWFWKACDLVGYPFGRLAQMLLLTGQRRREVAGLSYAEIDFTNRLWVIPGVRTKNGDPHEVPLSLRALSIIEMAPRIQTDKGYVFTTRAEKHVKGYSQAKAAIDRAILAVACEESPTAEIPRWTFHDLRRTAASGMARLGIDLPVIEKILNHSSGSFAGIVGVYQRHSFSDEKRKALEAWASFVMSVVEGKPASNVVAIRA